MNSGLQYIGKAEMLEVFSVTPIVNFPDFVMWVIKQTGASCEHRSGHVAGFTLVQHSLVIAFMLTFYTH